MNELQDQRAQLTRKFAEVSALRALYMERYGPILVDRERRRELERKLRVHDKTMASYAAACEKLALVCEELREPAKNASEDGGANVFRRGVLQDEEVRLCRYLAELKPTANLVRELQAQIAKLLPEDPVLAEMVETVQQNYNIVQEDLRRVEVALSRAKEATP